MFFDRFFKPEEDKRKDLTPVSGVNVDGSQEYSDYVHPNMEGLKDQAQKMLEEATKKVLMSEQGADLIKEYFESSEKTPELKRKNVSFLTGFVKQELLNQMGLKEIDFLDNSPKVREFNALFNVESISAFLDANIDYFDPQYIAPKDIKED